MKEKVFDLSIEKNNLHKRPLSTEYILSSSLTTDFYSLLCSLRALSQQSLHAIILHVCITSLYVRLIILAVVTFHFNIYLPVYLRYLMRIVNYQLKTEILRQEESCRSPLL